jgi:hypothetical protein
MHNLNLDEGSTVLVSIQSGILPFKAQVKEFKSDKLVLKLSNNFSIYNLLEKDKISLSHESQEVLQMIDCVIMLIDIQNNTLDLKIIQVNSFENKRAGERQPSSFYVNIVKLDSGEEVIANVRNVSLGGMMVFSKANLPINQKIKVHASLKDQNVDFIGVVKWKTALENYFEYGISNIF